jgi:hypothetical protein
MNIQKTLDPPNHMLLVFAIYWHNFIDVVLKRLQLPGTYQNTKNKGNEEMNYHMLFSEVLVLS